MVYFDHEVIFLSIFFVFFPSFIQYFFFFNRLRLFYHHFFYGPFYYSFFSFSFLNRESYYIFFLIFWGLYQLFSSFFLIPLENKTETYTDTKEKKKAISPLYGLTLTYNWLDWGPRSHWPHAPRLILGPIGITPRAPKPLHVQIGSIPKYCLVFRYIRPWK